MISLNDIVVTFNPGTPLEKRALRGISLDIPEGEFVTVIGSNGAGKSTVLGVLAGEVPVTSGSVEIDGRNVTRLPVQARAGDVARVFQDPNVGVCGALSIEENLALALMRGSRRGFARALTDERREQFRERLKILGMGLEDRLGDRIGLLSGGQRQALSLLMATFELLPQTPERIAALRTENGIYMAPNGRINIAGMSAADVGRVAQAIG